MFTYEYIRLLELKIRGFEGEIVLWFYGSNGVCLHLELCGYRGRIWGHGNLIKLFIILICKRNSWLFSVLKIGTIRLIESGLIILLANK